MAESPASVPPPESPFRTPLKFQFVCIVRPAVCVNVIYIVTVADNSDFGCNSIWKYMVTLTEGFQSALEQNISLTVTSALPAALLGIDYDVDI